MKRATGIGRRLAFAHGRVSAGFWPYRLAVWITLPALALGGLGLWLQPPPQTVIIPTPAQTVPAPAVASAQSAPAASSDAAICGQTLSGASSADDEQLIIDACSRLIEGAASGAGGLPAFEPYADRAFAEMGIGSTGAALADLAQALALDPSNDEIYRLRAGVYNGLKNFSAALADAQKALALRPANWAALVEQAAAEQGLYAYKAALTDASLACRHLPDYARAQLIRGEAEAALDDDQDAVRDITVYLQQSPPDSAALFWRGFAEGGIAGDQAMAMADFQASLQADPHNLDTLNELSDLSVAQGAWQAALGYAGRALAINPADMQAMMGRASAEFSLRNYAAAAADASAALKTRPDSTAQPIAWGILGISLYEQGHDKDAVPALVEAVRLNPGDLTLTAALAAARQKAAHSK
jgi:tetratricopeptide (TPR) repeat protein